MTWLDSTSCWWSGVPVGGRRTKPEASTAAEEPAHGVHAPAEDVLAKRPNWQAGRLVWEGGRHGPARGLRQFGGVDHFWDIPLVTLSRPRRTLARSCGSDMYCSTNSVFSARPSSRLAA